MIAAIIAYSISGFCFFWGLGLLVYSINRADHPSVSPTEFRFNICSAIAFGGVAWVFAYLGGLS